MNTDLCYRMVQSAPFAYASNRIILDDHGVPCDFELLDANTAFANLVQKDISGIINRRASELFPDLLENDFDWISIFGQVALEGGNKDLEYYFSRYERNMRIFIHSDEKYHFSTMCMDYTENRQNLQALIDSEEKYRSLVENLNEVLYVLNERAEIQYTSPNAVHISGYTPEELMNKQFLDFVHPADREGRMEQFQKIMSGKNEATEYRFVTKSGEVIWVRTSARPVIRDGKVTGVQGVLSDITDRKLTEQALQESEQRFRQIFEATPAISVQGYDRNRNVIYWNKASEVIYGYTREEALGRKLEELIIPEEMRTFVVSAIEEWVTDGVTIPASELVLQRSDGSPVPVFSSHIMLNNTRGEPEMYCIDIDLTQQKKAEEIIRNNLKEKDALLSEIHHRVKNNMAIISSLLCLESDNMRRKHPEKMLEETRNRIRSIAMVHELVYESGNFAQINFEALLHRLIKNRQEQIGLASEGLSFHIQADDVLLNTNVSVPLSLLANEIISNAEKHAFPGNEKGQIDIRFFKNGAGYRLVVEDNGVGVDDIGKLQQPDSFGYTIIHGLAAQLQGTIHVASKEQGLRVEARLPLLT